MPTVMANKALFFFLLQSIEPIYESLMVFCVYRPTPKWHDVYLLKVAISAGLINKTLHVYLSTTSPKTTLNFRSNHAARILCCKVATFVHKKHNVRHPSEYLAWANHHLRQLIITGFRILLFNLCSLQLFGEFCLVSITNLVVCFFFGSKGSFDDDIARVLMYTCFLFQLGHSNTLLYNNIDFIQNYALFY